jgi:hypothetical protein
MTTLTFTIHNAQWLSSNMRFRHWALENRRKTALRDMGLKEGLLSGLRFRGPVRVIVHIGYATNAVADPGNSAPALKALIDGMTRAGVWRDDDSKHVIGPDYRRDETKAPRGFHTVRLEIEEVD